jgi:hypothetical protein
MANEQLESFLAGETATVTEEPKAPPAEPQEPKVESKADPAAKPDKAKPDEDEADAEPTDRLEQDGKSYIPQQVLERERQRRQDWKARAVEAETKHRELQRQLDEATRRATAPPPQPQAPPQPPPDPATNPQGWAQHVVQQQQAALLNERLNNSEMMLADKIGQEKLSEYVSEFRQLANADPTLFGKLYSQPHPYAWLTREVDRLRLVRDVGDDPAAYREKILAEERVKCMQPSLGTARSVAGRTAGAWSGEPSLEDVLSVVQNRKRPNGAGGSVRY